MFLTFFLNSSARLAPLLTSGEIWIVSKGVIEIYRKNSKKRSVRFITTANIFSVEERELAELNQNEE